MPVRKFHSIEEMDAAQHELWCDAGEECFRRIARLWKRSAQIFPRTFPKGVVKYRTLGEAQADRERVLSQQLRQKRFERLASGDLRAAERQLGHEIELPTAPLPGR